MKYKQKQSYAPFGSVASKIKKNSITHPGPGAYDIVLPLISPIVQTIRKSNQNVIIKLGHIGTASFLAGGERFKQNNNLKNVGPGSYENYLSQKNSLTEVKQKRKNAAQKLKAIIRNQAIRSPTITNVKQLILDNDIQLPAQEIKQKQFKKKQNFKGISWSRMSEDRPQAMKQKSFRPGPGSYQVLEANKVRSLSNNPSSYFSSNSARSYLDQIIYETNQDSIARERSENKYKIGGAGPGSYQVERRKNEKFNKYQFFSSSQERI